MRATKPAPPAALHVPLWEIEDGLIVTSQGAYLVPYALTGLDSEHLPASVLSEAARQLYDGLKTDLPDHTYVQIVLEGHGDYEDLFARFEAQPPPNNAVLRLQRARRQDFLRNSGLRRHRLFAAVGSLEGLTRREFARFDAAMHAAKSEAAAQRARAWVGLMARVGVRARRLSELEIEQHLFAGLNPGRPFAPTRRWDLEANTAGEVWVRSRRAQLCRAAVEWSPDAVRLDGVPHKVFFLESLPDATVFTMMEALYHLGVDFRCTLHVQVPAQEGMQRALKYFRRIAHADAHRNANVTDPERLGRVQETNALAELLAETRQKLVRVGAQLVLWAEDAAALEGHVRHVADHLRPYGLVFAEEDRRHDWELPKSLLGLGTTFDRYKLLTSNNAGDLMPLFSACHGDKDPVLLVKTARHELFSFNPVEPARDNWNATIFGASGAGKSVFTNMLITTAMLGGPTSGRVFVVDFAGETKSSYLMVAKLFGGRFVPVVSRTADVALNPFPPAAEALDAATGKLTSETLNFLLVLTDLLLTNTGGDREAQLYRALLQRALQDVYVGRAPDEAPTYTDLAEVLGGYRGRSDIDRDRLAVLLELLGGFLASPDARFFLGEGAAPVTDAPFVIFDLFGIDSLSPQIAEALTFLTCQYVKRVAFEAEGTSYVVLDEVAQLLKRPEMVSLVDELYSTARKHGTSVWTVTQNYNSYRKSAVAETVKLNSTTQVFLSHASAADVRAQVAEDFDFTGREKALLEQLVTRKGAYSEVLLRTQVVDEGGEKTPITSKLRVELSPFDYELATSDARDRARQREWLAQNPGVPTARVLDALGQRRARRRSA